MVIFLIRPAESALGNASFLILVAAFIQPAEVPFAAVVEREFFTLLFVCAAWAWSNIGIAISHAVRRNKLAQAQTDILRAIQGDYIEVRPSIVCAVFLSVGSAVVLYIKIRFGPSPFLFASVLSCILLNICLTYGPLYPFAFYSLGQSVVVPLAVKAAINILLSAIFFPKSVNSQFVERLVAVLNPIADACGDQVKLLQTSPLDTPYTDPDSEKLEQPAPVAGKENKDGFDFEFVKKKLAAAEGGMMPMTMASRLLTREISFGIANGDDLRALERMSRSLIAPADGWSYYYTSIKADIQSAHFPRTPALDRSNQLLHNFVHKRDPAPVAIWESIRFGNLETFLHTSASNYITEMFAQLIRETSSDLLTTNAEAIRHIVAWLNHLNSHRYTFLHDRIFLSKEQRTEKGLKQAEETSKVIAGVEAKLADFRQSQRLKVLDPFKDALKAHEEAALSSHDLATELDLRTGPGEFGKIHHRYLYQAWLHQFHTISFTERMLELLREVETIQRQRTAAHVWYPHWPRIFSADVWRNSSGAAHETDEPDGEPDHIPDISSDTPAASRQRSRSSQTVVGDDSTHGSREGKDGLRDGSGEKTNKGATAHGHAHAHFGQADDIAEKPFDPIVDLGTTRARDPDALDPEGFLQVVGHTIYFWSRRPFHGNTLFGVKAAVLIALVSLPAFMKSSAGWCYENRAIWAIFMAQLTLARFRGETAFALLSRILATVIGGVFALVIWYISTGDGRGNAFGLGATTAVTFPFLMLFRIYFPGPPITPIIASVTTALIVGYSWKDVTNPLPGAPGYGWDTAWRRLVAVIIGVSAAYVFSYLPPTSTLRQYQRLSHAATIAELGRIYCAVVGIASHPHQQGGSTGPTTKSTQMQSRPESRRASLHHNNEEARSQIELVPQAEEHQLLNAHPSSDLVRKRIIAIRAKLRRLSMISVNVSYEFSLRGRWPAARYRELFDVQMQISKLLSHCLAIFERLGAAYSIALLRRTRFLDPRFLGDVVSVISMCSTALKTGEPLPQVTPCPLVDRFMDTPHGFNTYLPQDLAGPMDDVLASLPAKITMSTLQDAEYMTFSVGVATLFGLVVRIDKLCVAVKELVGESYAVPVDVHRMLGRRNGHH
uniref:ER transporter 6TM N-terminal domain-containing protein n=1 Tax=Kalmanozyma brasiliensis (strain GHG001) TaxID=1365824 RepID=V5GRQ2_KALBG